MFIIEFFTKIQSANTIKDKSRIMREFAQSSPDLFYNFVNLVYNTKLGIRNIDFRESGNEHIDDYCAELYEYCQSKTSNVKKFIESFSNKLTADDQKILALICRSKLNIGIGLKEINKIAQSILDIQELVFDSANHYMGCSDISSAIIKKFDFSNAIVQKKYDGLYAEHSIKNSTFRTRNGQILSYNRLRNIKPIDNIELPDLTICGELLVTYDGIELSREVSNGILNSEKMIDPLRLKYFCYDIKGDNTFNEKSYLERQKILNQIIAQHDDFEAVQSIPVKSMKEAYDYARLQFEQGFEGAILKDGNTKYKSGRSKQFVKIKEKNSIELRVIKICEGDLYGKAKDCGSLLCESDDKKISVKVSSLLDSEREIFKKNPEKILGKIVEIIYNKTTKPNKNGVISLFLPRLLRVDGVIQVRTDKNQTTLLSDLL